MSKIRRGARFAGSLAGPLALAYAGIQTSEAGQRMAGDAEDYARERKGGDTPWADLSAVSIAVEVQNIEQNIFASEYVLGKVLQ